MESLPEPARVRLPDGSQVYAYINPTDLPTTHQQPPQIVHQHIHQAPPDRTVQRVALGSGIGAGAVGASVYFGPLLVAALTSMAISLAVTALIIIAITWGLVTVVRSVGGPDGKAAAKNITQARRRG
ncbi:DUF6251 family protein [Streptomyces albipurpureus]|uniref:DUF6251 family protein n=1 Tax=Streptomyces albipurpureus TaxID=2897419 RepID=A0ABT0UVX2_9ACTN|nr:DUF6251 family protein [Streptomyces sp. CWNU-1]MCM2391331.1 DUF6251 family protein [Streptomyces sp. CWNU-1]